MFIAYKEIDRIRSMENLNSVNTTAIGTGNMKEGDRKNMLTTWSNKATGVDEKNNSELLHGFDSSVASGGVGHSAVDMNV